MKERISRGWTRGNRWRRMKERISRGWTRGIGGGE